METREMKFRAWDKIEKRMLHFSKPWYCDEYNSVCFEVEEESRKDYFGALDMEKSKEVELMQYTGLKDKNGKEIYEGDILQNRNGVISEVKWDSEQSRWISLSFGMTQKAIQRDKLFIIGNVYENPDLIK